LKPGAAAVDGGVAGFAAGLAATFFTAGFLAATFFTTGFLAATFLTAAGFLAAGFFSAGFLASFFTTMANLLNKLTEKNHYQNLPNPFGLGCIM
jgi:dolichol kinase